MAIQNLTTPAQYVVILIDLARQRGVQPAALLTDTSLSEEGLATMGARVSDEDFTRIVNRAYSLTGDRALGLHLGKRLNLSAHATVGQAFMTCENLEQVLDFFLKYYRILAPGLDLRYEQRDGRCWIAPHSIWVDERVQFSYEVLFAALVHSMQLLINEPELQFRLELPYPEPDYIEEYRQLFGDELFFSASLGSLSSTITGWTPCSRPPTRPCWRCMNRSVNDYWPTWKTMTPSPSAPCNCCASWKATTRKCPG
jgi:hypothetical protein